MVRWDCCKIIILLLLHIRDFRPDKEITLGRTNRIIRITQEIHQTKW